MNEIDRASILAGEGKIDVDCAKFMLHLQECENCRRDVFNNGEPLNREIIIKSLPKNT